MQLHYQTTGSGPPLVVLHGLFGSGDNWALVARSLASCFKVFTLDLRNHGRSPHHPAMDYSLMAADLAEFFSRSDLLSAHLLGHSMGGKVAMQYALRPDPKLKSLVVVDIAPGPQPSRHDDILQALLDLDLARYHTRAEMESALAPRIPDLAVCRFLLKSVTRNPDGGFSWQMNLPALYHNYENLNEGVTATTVFDLPTLFVRGELSDYVRSEDVPVIQRWFPRSRLVSIPGAGHWVHAEAPAAFSNLLLDFYRQNGYCP